MIYKRKIYALPQRMSAVFMIMALLWLTVSTPFVYRAQLAQASQEHKWQDQSNSRDNEEESNPFGNNTEEKAPSSTVISEEFLHDCHISHYFGLQTISFYNRENAGTYIAFHGELLVPPPNAA